MAQLEHYRKTFSGVLLGTAVGDSIGLPSEGMKAKRIKRCWTGPLKQRLILGRGMVSDDTEHTAFMAQSLIAHPNKIDTFQNALAWKLRWWLLGLPAGIGFATLRAILKLWIGLSPKRSGVHSAGNGPAMRSAIIGAFFQNDLNALEEYTKAATEITHTDHRAYTGALAIALCTRWAALYGQEKSTSPITVLKDLGAIHDESDTEWPELLLKMEEAFSKGLEVSEFAASLNISDEVTGYVYHTVPVAIYAWIHHYHNFTETVEAVVHCGGDTDTVGAIAGALAGATVGIQGIPDKWMIDIIDWPCSTNRLMKIAEELSTVKQAERSGRSIPLFWPAVILRNVFFILIVLSHGIRRFLPPY